LASFDALRTAPNIEIVGVITQPPRPVGRHQTLTPTPVATWAKQHHLPLFAWPSLRSVDVVSHITALRPDIAIVAAYGLIVPQTILNIPVQGCLNIHASLLPAYRGASPIAAALLNGEHETGVTFMRMDAGLDTGPIVQMFTMPIPPTATRPELETQLADLAANNIMNVISDYQSGRRIPQPQPTAGVSLTKKITRQDGLATWDDADYEVQKIRAYTPWPGVWTTWNSTVVKIERAHAEAATTNSTPGTVVPHATGWAIACRHGLLIPDVVQLAGKTSQPADEFLRGQPTFMGSVLGR
jgi:methionyl-tRNA formyltransferase